MTSRKHDRCSISRRWDNEHGPAILYCSSAPDTSAADAVAAKQNELSQQEFDWAKSLYADTAPQRADTQARQNAISDQQLALGKQQQDLTTEANQRYKTTFQPIEDKLVQQAQDYDTPERREQAAGQAESDVSTQVDAAKQGALRDMADRGVDASSGNAAIALSRIALGEGAARASAGNTARNYVETTGRGYLADAANLGRGIATSQGTTASLALNAGNSSAANSGLANTTGTSGANVMLSGFQGAQSGLAGASNTYLGSGKLQAGVDASNSAGTGAAIGGIAMAI